MRERSLVMVFEGMDAAGKGSTIRRVTRAMDARFYRVIPIAAPTDEERAQPYLWRLWRHIPGHGKAVIFDRSWYGRVLVERVEGFCSEADWMRAYNEINDFEEQLAEAGVEDQLGRNTRIAAAKDRRVGVLAKRELREDFLLQLRGPGLAALEPLVAVDQALERFVR
jgi:hypothetical protein